MVLLNTYILLVAVSLLRSVNSSQDSFLLYCLGEFATSYALKQVKEVSMNRL